MNKIITKILNIFKKKSVRWCHYNDYRIEKEWENERKELLRTHTQDKLDLDQSLCDSQDMLFEMWIKQEARKLLYDWLETERINRKYPNKGDVRRYLEYPKLRIIGFYTGIIYGYGDSISKYPDFNFDSYKYVKEEFEKLKQEYLK